MQQHPHVIKMAENMTTDINSDIMNAFHLPNTPANHSSRVLSTPESSAIRLERALRPAKALVTEPSGAVLLGMNVQHWSPNMAQTPPFSARSKSSASRFWNAIREVAANCSERPVTASLVRFDFNFLHIVMYVIYPINVFVWGYGEQCRYYGEVLESGRDLVY